MLLANVAVVLARPRFPENIGMAARACANMGCPRLIVIRPERWDFLKAEPLATPQGVKVLENIGIYPDIDAALAQFNFVGGSTARRGGWRKQICSPEDFAARAAALAAAGEKVALLFGSEDRGLSNVEICRCDALTNIATEKESHSLNLAQAVLLLLYELRKAFLKTGAQVKNAGPDRIDHGEFEALKANLRQTLLELDCLHGANPEYAFQLWHGILARAALKKHEYAALMGFCRQLRNRLNIRPDRDM